jgi:HlyD family secretion protein
MRNKRYTQEELKNIQLRSDDVQEILSRPPRWIIRWGTTVILTIIVVLLAGSWYFKYPDIVNSTILVTTENPPAPIIARANGKIDQLFVRDQQKVDKGQVLAVIENTANYRDILALEDKLTAIPSDSLKQFLHSGILDDEYKLGGLQSEYSTFLKELEDYQHFLELNYHQQKIQSQQEELSKYENRYNRLLNQKQIAEQEFQLIQKQFSRDSALYARQVIAEAAFEKAESALLRKKYELEQSEISLSNTRIEISRIEQNILDLKLEYRQQRSELKIAIAEALENLKASIKKWKHQYYLASPIQGTVTFTSFWSENQNVREGERVMTIVPENQGEIIGKLTLSFRGAGKVKEGQPVNIKFSNYPYLEYGMVRGIVRSISMVPQDQSYIVEVSLPDSLTTFYGKKLNFTQEMQGTAEIITEDKRLLEQVLKPIQFVFARNFERSESTAQNQPESKKEVATQKVANPAEHIKESKPSGEANPQPRKQAATTNQYHLIGGSFREKENAEDLRQKLQDQGFSAKVLSSQNGLHKVAYGSFSSLKKAKTELKRLEQSGRKTWIYKEPASSR